MANPRVLERLRKSQTDWSQEEFAKKLGLSKTTYQRILTGESAITIELTNAVAKLLKMDSKELFQSLQLDADDLDEGVTVQEPPLQIQRSVSVSIQLDGTPATLDYWVSVLRKMNAALA